MTFADDTKKLTAKAIEDQKAAAIARIEEIDFKRKESIKRFCDNIDLYWNDWLQKISVAAADGKNSIYFPMGQYGEDEVNVAVYHHIKEKFEAEGFTDVKLDFNYKDYSKVDSDYTASITVSW